MSTGKRKGRVDDDEVGLSSNEKKVCRQSPNSCTSFKQNRQTSSPTETSCNLSITAEQMSKKWKRHTQDLLISLENNERVASIDTLCEELNSSRDGHLDSLIIPALCKQTVFALMMENGINAEIKKLIYAMERILIHLHDRTQSDEIFRINAERILTAVLKVMNKCMECENQNDPDILDTMERSTAILLHGSRCKDTKVLRNRIANFDGILPTLLSTIDNPWPNNDIQSNAMATLTNLPSVKETAQKYVSFPSLFDSITTVLCSDSQKLKEYGLLFIHNLSQAGEPLILILEQKTKILDTVTEILCTESGTLKEYAAAFIYKLTMKTESFVKILGMKPKLLKAIAKLIDSEKISMQKQALRIFEKLAKFEKNTDIIEQAALDKLILPLKKMKENEEEVDKYVLLTSSKLLVQLANDSVSAHVMADKIGIMDYLCNALLSNTTEDDVKANVSKIIRCLAITLKSPTSPNYSALMKTLASLSTVKAHVDRACWFLHYHMTIDIENQSAILSTDSVLEALSNIILDDDSSVNSCTSASSVFLNFSANHAFHKKMLKQEKVLQAIVYGAKDFKNNPEGEKVGVKYLLIRSIINLALNKNNVKLLMTNEDVLPLLAAASIPRTKAFVGAREAIYTILEE